MLLEVKQEMKQLLEHKSKAKAKKSTDMEEIRVELRGTMGRKHHTLCDEDEEEGDEDVYMYSVDMKLNIKEFGLKGSFPNLIIFSL